MPDPNCEIPKFNATSDEIRAILEKSKTIAVVGISNKENRPSHQIAWYLKQQGYNVIGVNPNHEAVFGEKVFGRLTEIVEPVDVVNIFMRPENIGPIVDDAIAKKAKIVWMQEGIVNNEAAEKARAAGLTVVMNKCIYKEHLAL